MVGVHEARDEGAHRLAEYSRSNTNTSDVCPRMRQLRHVMDICGGIAREGGGQDLPTAITMIVACSSSRAGLSSDGKEPAGRMHWQHLRGGSRSD